MSMRMTIDAPPGGLAEPLLRRLSAPGDLSEDEIALLRGLAGRAETRPGKTEIFSEGEAVGRPLVLLDGWACRQRILLDGRRQILMFLLPGDMVGLKPWPMPRAYSSVMTLGGATIADASPLRDAIRCDDPRWRSLVAACAAVAGLEQIRLCDQIVRLGRQTAYERMAHLLLELYDRLAVAGLADDWQFTMPLTQEALADASGLSSVHVNRTLQQLRRDRLVEVKGGLVALHDPGVLARIADFRGMVPCPV